METTHPTPSGETGEKPVRADSSRKIIYGLIALLLITNAATAYIVIRDKKASDLATADSGRRIQTSPAENLPVYESTELAVKTEPAQAEPETATSTATVEKPAKKEPVILSGEIKIDWTEWPVLKSDWALLDYTSLDALIEEHNRQEGDRLETGKFMQAHSYYKVGTVSQGPYKGKELYLFTFRPEGLAFRDEMYRIIKNDAELVLLSNYSDQTWGIYDQLFVKNDKIKIANFNTPDTIKIPDSDIVLVRAENSFELFTTIEKAGKVLEYTDGKFVYENQSKNCYIATAPDGTYFEYYFKLGFLEQNSYQGTTPHTWNIKWNDGDPAVHEFTFRGENPCGSGPCYDYAPGLKPEELIAVGTSPVGAVYELRDKRNVGLNNSLYEELTRYQKKLTFDEFIAGKPLIFWKGPFGNYLKLRNAEYQPGAECGKPVIYLYPEKKMDVLVKVMPSGGFTFTEPAYGKGWKVNADPASNIYNYQDGKNYPYLFWEGLALGYRRPEKGFVVKREDVKGFLEEKLALQGLIEKEYSEFIEFWLPKMQAKPFYFITFVSQAEFDRVAPLAVYPKPDTVIRVFMDFEGLDRYQSVEAQTLSAPARLGFTVVEWGGALHDQDEE